MPQPHPQVDLQKDSKLVIAVGDPLPPPVALTLKQGQEHGPAVENKLSRGSALATPTPSAGNSLPESQSSVPRLLFFPFPEASSLQPHHRPRGPMCFTGPHAHPKHPRHNSKVQGLRTPSAQDPSGRTARRGDASGRPQPPHPRQQHVYCGTFYFPHNVLLGLNGLT